MEKSFCIILYSGTLVNKLSVMIKSAYLELKVKVIKEYQAIFEVPEVKQVARACSSIHVFIRLLSRKTSQC